MRKTQTFELQWQDLPETSMPKLQQSPWEKGKVGVERAKNEFLSQGGHDVVKEVTIEVNGTCTRIDLVGYDKDGVLSEIT